MSPAPKGRARPAARRAKTAVDATQAPEKPAPSEPTRQALDAARLAALAEALAEAEAELAAAQAHHQAMTEALVPHQAAYSELAERTKVAQATAKRLKSAKTPKPKELAEAEALARELVSQQPAVESRLLAAKALLTAAVHREQAAEQALAQARKVHGVEKTAQLTLAAAESFPPAVVDRAWQAALDDWGMEVTISPPEPLEDKGAEAWGGAEPLAYIDLVKRQVVVNFPFLIDVGAASSLAAVLSHELGHHLKFPHTLGLSASLHVLEQKLIPGLKSSLTNLFFDLQVNEFVGRTRADELSLVYQGFSNRKDAKLSPLFQFYLSIYEELWSQEPGHLSKPEWVAALEEKHPGARADARMFVQTFYALDDVYLQFVYFCCQMLRYLDFDPSADPGGAMPLAGDVQEPDADDYLGCINGNPSLDRALEEAKARGWIDPKEAAGNPNVAPQDALSTIERLGATRPGSSVEAFRDTLVGHVYKQLVEKQLVALPETPTPGPDPFLPTLLEDWDSGDSPRAIDWTATVLKQGALAALNPLKRVLEVEPPSRENSVGVGVEIYLDTSGSMPNPKSAVNAMTLAAQILSASAIRRGGKVRGVIYSSEYEHSGWMYNEDTARTYLLRYSGGGTQFPFGLFNRFAVEDKGVIRALISDSDFLYNVSQKGAMASFMEGVSRCRMFIALLALPDLEAGKKALAPALGLPQLRLAVVTDYAQLPQAAARLTQAIWGK